MLKCSSVTSYHYRGCLAIPKKSELLSPAGVNQMAFLQDSRFSSQRDRLVKAKQSRK